MSINWYLIQTKARQECMAELNLKRLDIEVFNPSFKQNRRNRYKKQVDRKCPLFPGYLFARIDISTEFRKVTYAHGVFGVVKFGTAAAVVGEEVIRSIKARYENGLVVLSPPSSLKPGQVVHIAEGPFRGFEAIFEQALNGLERVALLLRTVGYQGRIVINRDCLAM